MTAIPLQIHTLPNSPYNLTHGEPEEMELLQKHGQVCSEIRKTLGEHVAFAFWCTLRSESYLAQLTGQRWTQHLCEAIVRDLINDYTRNFPDFDSREIQQWPHTARRCLIAAGVSLGCIRE